MKKLLPILVVLAIIAAGVGGYFLVKNDNKLVSSTPESKATTSSFYKVVNACDAFTEADAKVVLGAAATKGDLTSVDNSTDDVNVSTCSYSEATTLKTATLLARSAKSADGAASNRVMFTTGTRPPTAQVIADIGDSAYWDPTYGQLNILMHNNWYILTSGGLKPSDKTVEDAKVFAARILPRL